MLKDFNCINSSFWSFGARSAMFSGSGSEFIETGSEFTESESLQTNFIFFLSCPTPCALAGRRNLELAACTIRRLILVSFVMGPHIFLYAAIHCTFSISMLLASRSLVFLVIACDDTSNCNAHTQIIQSHSMGYWLFANTKYRGRAPQVVHSDHNFLSV